MQTIASGFPAYHNMEEGGNHFGVDFSPIYALFQPLMDPFETVLPLIVAQGVAGGLTGAGVFFLARRLMPERRAVGVAVRRVRLPGAGRIDLRRPVRRRCSPAATVWLLYGFEARKVTVIVVATLAALGIKEDQAIFLTVTGLFLAWRHRHERQLLTCGLAVAARPC